MRRDQLLEQLKANPRGVRFADLETICREYFGEPRRTSGSHLVFKTPWPGDPRVNIQNDHGMAKPYQVRQVLNAIDRLNEERRAQAEQEEG